MERKQVAWVAALCFAAGAAPSSQQPPSQPPPSFRSGVEAVSVDVSVLDEQGQPVRELGPADFVVTVAGRPRRVVSANFVDVTSTAPGAAGPSAGPDRLPLSTNDVGSFGRLLVFVVDQNTLDQSEVRHVANAASRFFERLTPADRSALVLMPIGTGVPFTADHDRVHEALQRATGLAGLSFEPPNAGLDEIRAIAAGDFRALQNAASRECPAEGLGNPAAGFATGGGAGGASSPGGAAGGQAGGGGGSGDATRGAAGGGSGSAASSSADSCTRRIQFEATSAWHQVHNTALASLTSLRSVLRELKKVAGDKTVVLISGGWPLELREGTSELTPVAALAADARVTLFTLFAASAEGSADRRVISTTPLADQSVRRWPLQTIASMTGGESFRVDVGAASVFERLARELSAYYRLGVEQEAADLDGKVRPMKVQVARRGATVRAREGFVGRSYAERDAPARLEAALTSPLPATGVGLRLTSYLVADPDNASHVKILLVGDAFRLQPGEATLQLALRDATGKALTSAGQSLGEATSERLPFSTSLSVEPGRYLIRAAVMDGAGTVGSVDHFVEARRTPVGSLSVGDLLLAHVPGRADQDAGFVLDGVRQDERLALQLDLVGDRDRVAETDVVFEVAASDTGPALLTAEATRMSGSGSALAQAVTDMRLLPAGRYVARARATSDAGVVGVVRRAFVVTEGPAVPSTVVGESVSTVAATPAVAPIIARVSASVPPFAVEQVLAPPVLGAFLDRLAARPDAASPSVQPLLDRMRNTPAAEITVPDAVTSEAPAVASFLAGVSLLARDELDPAAQAFRTALRASSDFYPAMVYLGACFAAGGKDLEAAGAWQTALIKEGDVAALHQLLIDALLRLGRGAAAFDAIERARRRWPDEPAFKRRFVITAVAAGRYADALAVLDNLQPGRPEDEPALALGLQVLYEAITTSHPVDSPEADRARMLRYAEAYRRLNGPSVALVDAWVAAATRER